MRLLVDTGVFSAALSRRRRAMVEVSVARLAGHQMFLAAQTVAELRFGALVAGWGEERCVRLEQAIAAATVVPITDALLHAVAQLRFECRTIGHPLADRTHHADLWIAATAIHLHTPLVTLDGIFDRAPGLTFV